MASLRKTWFERLCYNLGTYFRSRVLRWRWIQVSLTGTDEESFQAEREAGRDMKKYLTRARFPVDNNPKRTKLVRSLGAELSRYVRNRNCRFDFTVVKSETANAFALPGGFVLITRPLIELCEYNGEEIAAALAHEMAHVILFHARDRVTNSAVLSFLALVARLSDPVSGLARKFSERAYSREQEFEADHSGICLMTAAGHSRDAYVRMLRRLQHLSAAESTGLDSYLTSHPPVSERIKRIRKEP